MPKVSAREFQQNVGHYQDVAIAEPVEVTKHGRRHVVVLSDKEYRRLKRQDRQAFYVWELPPEVIEDIKRAEVPAEYAYLDAELDD